jgi:hypothetical protein
MPLAVCNGLLTQQGNGHVYVPCMGVQCGSSKVSSGICSSSIQAMCGRT